MTVRKGEGQQTWPRASRYFNVGDHYYFSTREGLYIGPFDSMLAAERGLSIYIQYLQEEEADEIFASIMAMEGPWSSSHFR